MLSFEGVTAKYWKSDLTNRNRGGEMIKRIIMLIFLLLTILTMNTYAENRIEIGDNAKLDESKIFVAEAANFLNQGFMVFGRVKKEYYFIPNRSIKI